MLLPTTSILVWWACRPEMAENRERSMGNSSSRERGGAGKRVRVREDGGGGAQVARPTSVIRPTSTLSPPITATDVLSTVEMRTALMTPDWVVPSVAV